MKHTKEYCNTLLKKVLEDVKRQRGEEFYDEKASFKAIYKEDEKNFVTNQNVKSSWLVYAKVPKQEYELGGNIIIHVDDDTGKALTFVNTALGGRPITLPLEIDEEGKYFIPQEYLPE